MAVELDATPKGANSNSYVTLEEAEAYFASRLNSAVWTVVTDDDLKSMALIAACRRMEIELEYEGYISSSTQALKLPRVGLYTRNGVAMFSGDTIPQVFKDAQCEQAAAELAADLNAETGTRGISDVKVSSIYVRFDPNRNSDDGSRVVRIVWDMLEPWLENSRKSGGMLYSVDLERV